MTRPIGLCAVALLGAITSLGAQCTNGQQPPCPVPAPSMSVAVLTFQSLSRDTNDVFLAEGLADDIAARLGQIDRIVVRSREAVRRLPNAERMGMRELGQQLGAAYILSGSVRPSGGRLRVIVELAKAQTSQVVWTSPFDRTLDDMLGMQTEIASAVAGAVAGRLGAVDARRVASAPTANAEAFSHIVRGTAFLARRMREHALPDFREAVRLDSKSAVAWARLSQAFSLCANVGCGTDSIAAVRRQARAAADRALALDSNLADAWLADGLELVNSARPDVPAARTSLERAVHLDKQNAEAQHILGAQLIRLGENGAAKQAYRRALAIDPGRAITWNHLAILANDEGRFAEQEAFADTALALSPEFGEPAFYKWSALLHQNAFSRMRALKPLRTDSLDAWYEETFAALAERDSARAIVALNRILAMPGPPRRQLAAVALARVGRREEAATLIRGWGEPGFNVWHGLRSPTLSPLRGIPEFDAYVERARQRAFWTARQK